MLCVNIKHYVCTFVLSLRMFGCGWCNNVIKCQKRNIMNIFNSNDDDYHSTFFVINI